MSESEDIVKDIISSIDEIIEERKQMHDSIKKGNMKRAKQLSKSSMTKMEKTNEDMTNFFNDEDDENV